MSYRLGMEAKRGVLSGLRRGMEIAIDPSPERLRELQKQGRRAGSAHPLCETLTAISCRSVNISK